MKMARSLLAKFQEWTPSSDLVWWKGGLQRSALYFQCLLSCDSVLSRGVSAIKHKMVEGYYLALLQAQDLAPLELKRDDLRRYSSAAFRRFVQTGAMADLASAEEPLAIADVVGSEAVEDGGLAADLFALHYDAGAGLVRPVVARCPAEFPIADVCIRWDGCSHSSGVQRGYVACARADHRACFRYMAVSVVPSRRDLVVNLLAWWYEAQRQPLTRAEHQAYRPTAEAIAFVESNFGVPHIE